jgi:tRNA pseudouridine32 synthase / 23S rRNA pseudouridine746 synthase
MDILFQNQDFVAVDKPPLMLSTPPRFADDRPVAGRLLEKQLDCQLWPVHRLDFEVSGLVLFALNAAAHRAANQLFEKTLVQKKYQALTEPWSAPPAGRQIWKRQLLRGKKRAYESSAGSWAVTEAELVRQTSDFAEWLLEPRTGKPHQLRVELYLQGYPILGDELYSSKQKWRWPGIALRAISLEFPPEFVTAFKLPSSLSVSPFQI